MRSFKYNPLLLAIVVLGLLVSLFINAQRHGVEEKTRQVDLAIDYSGLMDLAVQSGVSPKEVFRMAKEAGITSLAVYDKNFKRLNLSGLTQATAGSAIWQNYRTGVMTSPRWRYLVESGAIKPQAVYITGGDAETFAEVKEDLIRRLGSDRVASLEADDEVLEVSADYEALYKMDLGLSKEEMRAANDAGFTVIARPSNYHLCTADDVRGVFRRLDGIDVSAVVFSGQEMLGATDSLAATVEELKARDMTLGLIEHTSQLRFYQQEGLEEVARLVGYDHIARLYSIPKDEQPKLKIDTAVERWGNTDEERNIRIDLLRIYEKPAPGMTLLETNLKYFKDTHDLLAAKGYTFGKPARFEAYYPSRYLVALVVMGATAAAVLYLTLILPPLNSHPRVAFLLALFAGSLMATPVLMGSGSKIRLLAAFISANVFPAIAVTWLLDRFKDTCLREGFFSRLAAIFGLLVLTSLISLSGAAYLSGALSDVEYFLEFNIYRGIKLTFVLPLVLVAIAFLVRFDIFSPKPLAPSGRFWGQVASLFDMPVRLKTLLLFFLGLALVAVFIARSGHTSGLPVPAWELKFRAFLETSFYARPRSKELLIGHPAFMLLPLIVKYRLPAWVLFGCVLCATIGQGSMVETFAHMRTPVEMSLVRGALGVGLGGILGMALTFLLTPLGEIKLFWRDIS